MREHDIYFSSRFDLHKKNTGICGDTLINSHWEELIRKVEQLFHATNHLDNNYHMLI